MNFNGGKLFVEINIADAGRFNKFCQFLRQAQPSVACTHVGKINLCFLHNHPSIILRLN
jgi:hypothetical protein